MWWAQQGALVGAVALALFGAAGRLSWAAGWVQVALMAGAVVGQAAVLGRWQPALVAARVRPLAGGKRWDVALAATAALGLPLLTCVVAALDERWGWSPALPGAIWAGAAGVWALGYALFTWAMASNPFFAATVGIQTGQAVAWGGPYHWLRHPGYAGALLVQLARPLLLDSLWAVAPALLSMALYLLRTHLEDRTLRAGLAGYEEYARAVRWRLLPGVW